MLNSNDQIKKKMRLLIYIFFLPAIIYIVAGLYYQQIVKHDTYLEKAKNQYTAKKNVITKRGEIYTDDGGLLVSNIPCFNIIGDPSLMQDTSKKNKDENIFIRNRTMSAIIIDKYSKFTRQEIYDRLAPKRYRVDRNMKRILDDNGNPIIVDSRYAILAKEVSLDDVEIIKGLIKTNKIKGISFESTYKRVYPKNSMLANILGFNEMRRDEKFKEDMEFPLFGIEKIANEYLESDVVKKSYEISRRGQEIAYGNVKITDKLKDGKNVYLTINEVIQSIVEEELDQAVKYLKPKAIYAIMINPKNGNVLAIAQRPTFNPNERETINVDNTKIRLISDVFEPGSIIKPFTVAYAIDNNLVTPDTIFDCENGYWFFRGAKLTDSHAYKNLTVTEIIKHSSNIGTAKIGIMIGVEKLHSALYKFGFGQKTGIGLKPESIGLFHPTEKWFGTAISRVPMGYFIGVTPVQMIRAWGALADNGNLRELRLIDRVVDTETNEVEVMPYKESKQMFNNKATSHIMSYMLAQVSRRGGTATKAQVKGFNVAAKTGTSKKHITGHGYSNKYYGSLVGFVPAENPEFVLLITVDEATNGQYYGGTVAGPVFSRIATKVLKYLNINPDNIEKFEFPEEAEHK